jgi:hypothetical protein
MTKNLGIPQNLFEKAHSKRFKINQKNKNNKDTNLERNNKRILKNKFHEQKQYKLDKILNIISENGK